MSTQCSTTELHAHSGRHVAAPWPPRKPVLSLVEGPHFRSARTPERTARQHAYAYPIAGFRLIPRRCGGPPAAAFLSIRRNFKSEERRGGKECVRTCRARWSAIN